MCSRCRLPERAGTGGEAARERRRRPDRLLVPVAVPLRRQPARNQNHVLQEEAARGNDLGVELDGRASPLQLLVTKLREAGRSQTQLHGVPACHRSAF